MSIGVAATHNKTAFSLEYVKTSEAVRENILDQSNETCELLEL
jgi:hypothetical protein